jgi:hypothetical protein
VRRHASRPARPALREPAVSGARRRQAGPSARVAVVRLRRRRGEAGGYVIGRREIVAATLLWVASAESAPTGEAGPEGARSGGAGTPIGGRAAFASRSSWWVFRRGGRVGRRGAGAFIPRARLGAGRRGIVGGSDRATGGASSQRRRRFRRRPEAMRRVGNLLHRLRGELSRPAIHQCQRPGQPTASTGSPHVAVNQRRHADERPSALAICKADWTSTPYKGLANAESNLTINLLRASR